MAAERAQQDAYTSNRERQPTDSATTTNNDAHHHHHNHHQRPEPDREAYFRLEQQVSYNYACIQSHGESLARFDRMISGFQSDVMRALEDLRNEIRTRHAPADGPVHGRDVEMLAAQIANVTTKVNEIDNIRIQVELLKSKTKRLEGDSTTHALQVPPRPASATSHRDNHDAQPAQQQQQQPPPPPQQQQHQHHHHQPLPPIHTGGAPSDHRPQYHPIDIQARPPSEGHIGFPQGHRPGEPLPPPSSLSGWRPGQAPSYDRRSHGPEESWPAPKRPFEEPVREGSVPSSPKRPKLAPLKPRSTFEEHPPYPEAQYPRHEPPPPQLLTTPASATIAPSSYRFITSTTPSEGPDSWRGDDGNLTPAPARARGRGSGPQPQTQPARNESRRKNGQEHDTEWEKNEWHAPQQLSPNGYYARPMIRHDGQPEYPLTPIASAVSPHDHSMMPDSTSSGKKTRTKPVRNSEGILIRKDGRPDMRSVSSANNLRKVHAKKEAERAETDGRTPSSARSLAPANSMSDDEQSEEQAVVSRSATPKTGISGHAEKSEEPVTSAPTSAGDDEKKGEWLSRPEEDNKAAAEEMPEKQEIVAG